jgi:hypothetical protein
LHKRASYFICQLEREKLYIYIYREREMVGCREVTESFRRIRKVRTVGNLRKITMVMMVLKVMGWWG